MMLSYFTDIQFANPGYLFLLGLIPFMLGWTWWRRKVQHTEIKMPGLEGIRPAATSWRIKVLPLLHVLRVLAFAGFVVALARPQSLFSEQKINTEGIDIVLTLDISPSMMAFDFRPNRIEAAKKTAIDFVEGRPNDRIGLVVFAGEAFTQCPITLDHQLLKSLTLEADDWQLKDGTAIGDGLWVAVNRLMDTTSLQSKIIILLTDGVRNAGEYAPTDAALAAADLGIRIYTIGIGSESSRPIPVLDKSGKKIFELSPNASFDEESLQEIADITGGRYFHASSNKKLEEIYREIDKLEKQKIEVNISQRKEEKFYPFAALAIVALSLEILLSNTLLRRLT